MLIDPAFARQYLTHWVQTCGCAVKIGLIGNGAIARTLSKFCAARSEDFEIVGAICRGSGGTSVGTHPLKASVSELLAVGPEVIIECAGPAAVTAHAVTILERGVNLIIVSTGSLADDLLLRSVREAVSRSSSRISLPAGALAGIDALSAARLAGLTAVALQSSKPPWAWSGTAAEKEFALESLARPTVIFEGDAREAAITFPKNANVAATAALAGIGFDRTRVRLIADPGLTQNLHRLEAAGAFGELTIEVRAHPAADNMKTSLLAALSVMRLLDNEASGVAI